MRFSLIQLINLLTNPAIVEVICTLSTLGRRVVPIETLCSCCFPSSVTLPVGSFAYQSDGDSSFDTKYPLRNNRGVIFTVIHAL